MDYVRYTTLENTEESIIQVEKLRYNAYGYDPLENEEEILDISYYAREIKRGNMMIFASFIEDEMCAACYVSYTASSIFIDQLFVKKEYQEFGLKLGRRLLAYVNANKHLVEEHFKVPPIYYSKLAYTTEKSKALYKKVGYKESNRVLGIMKKHI